MRGVSRRSVLSSAACALAYANFPGVSFASERSAADAFARLTDEAARLARAPYQPPSTALPAPFDKLNYDGYRRLRPRDERAIWRGKAHGYSVLPLPRGFFFREGVSLSVNEGGAARALTDGANFVDFVDYPETSAADRAELGMSGWRLLQKNAVGDGLHECGVFQGASYFRMIADQLAYGLSARGLAIRSGGAEEFPSFRSFEIFEPTPGAQTFTALALLDSPSVAGAYRFDIAYGAATIMDVDAILFARTDVDEPGIAPMSSMFLRGRGDATTTADQRPEVHDSDGLAIHTARGERLWRALANPGVKQYSAFHETNPKGFGLLQRQRGADAYRDPEARYEARPSLWVTPRNDWGAGHVMLIEFSTIEEYHDNVVAFWKPDISWRAGDRHQFAYRLTWDAAGPQTPGRVLTSETDGVTFTIDFDTPFAADAGVNVWSSAGAVGAARVSPTSGGTRLSFDLTTNDASPIELRAALRSADGRETSETWLYRWTRA